MKKYNVTRKVKPFQKGEILSYDSESKILTSINNPEISMSFDLAKTLGISIKEIMQIDGLDGKYQDVSSMFTEMRNSLNLTQKDLSEFLNISRTSIVNIELGRQIPSVLTLQRIAEDLGYKISFLLEKNNDTQN